MKKIDGVIEFIKEIEGLKSVTRTAWTKTGRRESTAEHSWRLAMLLMLIDGVIEFIKEIEGLKSVTRTAWTKTGRRESTAEHSWRLAMLLMLLEEEFDYIDINKAIKMSLVHDLGELYDGDISAVLQTDDNIKLDIEERAMKRMLTTLPESISKNIYDLWCEYNSCSTKEAKLVKAMDKLETIVQHNQGNNPHK